MANFQTVKEAEIQRKNRANEVHPKITTLETELTELVEKTQGLSGLAKTKAQLGVIKKYADQIKYSPADKSSKPRLDECISSITVIIENEEKSIKSGVRLPKEQSRDPEIIDAIVNEDLKSCVTNHLNAMVHRHYKTVYPSHSVFSSKEKECINTANSTLDAIEKSTFYNGHKAIEKKKAEAQRKAEENQDREEFVFVAKPDALEPQSLSMFQRIKNALTRTKPETSTNISANRVLDGQGQSRQQRSQRTIQGH